MLRTIEGDFKQLLGLGDVVFIPLFLFTKVTLSINKS